MNNNSWKFLEYLFILRTRMVEGDPFKNLSSYYIFWLYYSWLAFLSSSKMPISSLKDWAVLVLKICSVLSSEEGKSSLDPATFSNSTLSNF